MIWKMYIPHAQTEFSSSRAKRERRPKQRVATKQKAIIPSDRPKQKNRPSWKNNDCKKNKVRRNGTTRIRNEKN
jgi:hypothetical protein